MPTWTRYGQLPEVEFTWENVGEKLVEEATRGFASEMQQKFEITKETRVCACVCSFRFAGGVGINERWFADASLLDGWEKEMMRVESGEGDVKDFL
jgi:hypothetical protein